MSNKSVSLGYLRSFITVLVIAHHSFIAYSPFSLQPLPSLLTEPRWWRAFPIVDSRHWLGFALVLLYNDQFFMALMFLLSGIFVWGSLQRKGVAKFVEGRAIRLGLPFFFCMILAPLEYFPAYLVLGKRDIGQYFHIWLSLPDWPVGPAWFLWLLLVFNVTVGSLVASVPRSEQLLRATGSIAEKRPAIFFAWFVGLSLCLYLPLVVIFGPWAWSSIGPFSVQTSRILLYALFFLTGVAIGTGGPPQRDGKLARWWPAFAVTSCIAYCLSIAAAARSPLPPATSLVWNVAGSIPYGFSCVSTSLAAISLCTRFVNKRYRLLESLENNAYGIYVVHYGVVIWLQYGLLHINLPAFVKGPLVLASALGISWVLAGLFRSMLAFAFSRRGPDRGSIYR